jgi:hypothetical protein
VSLDPLHSARLHHVTALVYDIRELQTIAFAATGQ